MNGRGTTRRGPGDRPPGRHSLNTTQEAGR